MLVTIATILIAIAKIVGTILGTMLAGVVTYIIVGTMAGWVYHAMYDGVRCTECRRILWPWQKRGFTTMYAPAHRRCELTARLRAMEVAYRHGAYPCGKWARLMAEMKREYENR